MQPYIRSRQEVKAAEAVKTSSSTTIAHTTVVLPRGGARHPHGADIIARQSTTLQCQWHPVPSMMQLDLTIRSKFIPSAVNLHGSGNPMPTDDQLENHPLSFPLRPTRLLVDHNFDAAQGKPGRSKRYSRMSPSLSLSRVRAYLPALRSYLLATAAGVRGGRGDRAAGFGKSIPSFAAGCSVLITCKLVESNRKSSRQVDNT